MLSIMKLIVTTFLLLFSTSLRTCQAVPTLSTWSGAVSGVEDQTSTGKQFYKFLGVPYAEPPIGKLRFKDPVAKTPWDGTLNATEFQEICLQKTFLEFPVSLTGSEDCLYLNIYTPQLEISDLKPVIFWIHGGGFEMGESNEGADPGFLLEEDVLVVTVHYRLGPLGFLALEDNPSLAGNIGLKDQQEALKWVHQNIKYFGGDPYKVTLMGESAGAVSVHAHVLSPRIKNIFQGAILQSGTTLMMYDVMFNEMFVQKSTRAYLDKIGCNVSDVVECLQNTDAEILMQLTSGDSAQQSQDPAEGFFWIVQDSVSPSPVLPYNPLGQLIVGNVKKVPLIMGRTKDDGGLLVYMDPAGIQATFEENNTTKLMEFLGLGRENITDEEIRTVNVMKKVYLSGDSYAENEKNLIKMATDGWYGSEMAEVTKYHQKVAPVFPYVLNERCNDFSFSSLLGGGDKDYGVTHADDLNCFFKPPEYYGFGSLSEVGTLISRALIKSWTNFAKNKDPSQYGNSELVWPPGEIMFFESQSGLKHNESQHADILERNLLWDKLYWSTMEDQFQNANTVAQSLLTYINPYNWFK